MSFVSFVWYRWYYVQTTNSIEEIGIQTTHLLASAFLAMGSPTDMF